MAELNERQELFCRCYVLRPVGSWAAVEAGYEPRGAGVQACRLLDRPAIRARIAELRAQVARQHARDTDALLAKLESICELSLKDHQYHAAVRVVTLQARLAGLLPERGATRAVAAKAATEAVAAETAMAEGDDPGEAPAPAAAQPAAAGTADAAPVVAETEAAPEATDAAVEALSGPDSDEIAAGRADAAPRARLLQNGAGRIFNVPTRPRTPPGMLSDVNRCISPPQFFR